MRWEGDAHRRQCAIDMCCTCRHADHMAKMIQIREVPDEVHRTFKVRAAEAGMPLSDYLKAELARIAELPTVQELNRRVAALPRVKLKRSPASIIRERRGR